MVPACKSGDRLTCYGSGLQPFSFCSLQQGWFCGIVRGCDSGAIPAPPERSSELRQRKSMGKRVQVVLNRDVSKLGRTGDLVEVAPGYARNYLLPQGLAITATPSVLRQVEYRRQKERERLAEIKRQAEAQKTALATIGRLTIVKQGGEGKAIFGTVTSQDVADTILEKAGQQVDKRNITVPEIDSTGVYDVELKLHPEVTATVQIEVIAK